MKTLLITFIRLYRFLLSPFFGNQCRFYPTCSAYGLQALEKHGALKGSILAVKRLLRCHPWYKGEMLDEVPESVAWGQLFGYKQPHSINSDQK